MTTVGVLGLQGDVREHVRAIEDSGASAVDVRTATGLGQVDGLVLPGGESTTIGRLLRLFDLMEPLQQAVRDGLPVYGSCAGMILLADFVLDGLPGQPLVGGLDVTVRRNAFGSQVESFEATVPVQGVGDVTGVFIRAPWVEQVGPGATALATLGPDGPGAGRVVAVRQGNLLATSFHPELTGDHRVHRLFVQIVEAHA